MYEEVFEEFQLTVVELPIEFVDDLPVYRGHLKELTFLSAEASSRGIKIGRASCRERV